MINMFITNGTSFYVLPRASYRYIQSKFIPSVIWRFSNNFSNSFRGRTLALTRESSYIFEFILGVVGRHVGGCQTSRYVWQSVLGGICTSLYICISPIHLYIPPYIKGTFRVICTPLRNCCVCQYICLSISSSIACQQLYNCRPVILVNQHHCLSLAVSCVAGLVTYVIWVLFLLLCFCLFGLEACHCMLRLILNRDCIPFSLIPLRHWNCTHHGMSLMSLLLQSLLGFSAQFMLFCILLNHSLLLVSDLINCGARLGHYFHLCNWSPRSQHLN